MPTPSEVLEVAGREVTITNPGKIFFPRGPRTKLDLVRYYLSVAEGALRGIAGRPMALKRYPNGVDGQSFYQKRAPKNHPEWVETVELAFPSGRTAREIVVRDAAQLAWVINLGCLELHPHPVRASDLEHPDELRVDLDPVRGIGWPQVRDVALVAGEALRDFGLTGWPKTSGSRGLHILCRIEPRWEFGDVRRAALALAREVERRAPDLATSRWWKEERHGVFIDYNQNAKDRTTAAAYSVRPTPDARVSCPLTWDEVQDCDPADYTMDSVPERFAVTDPSRGIDEAAGSLEELLRLADEDEAAGLGDAPWPPHFAKQKGEPPRVQPSRRRGGSGRRQPVFPLIEIARAATEDEAMAGLERWKAQHPGVFELLAPEDVLVDSMRGRSSTWTRIRLNLRNVPEGERPAQEPLELDYDPWAR